MAPGYIFPPGQPYGWPGHMQEYGTGSNTLRTPRISQPRMLQSGDILANGQQVLSDPREAGNGGVWVCLGVLPSAWVRVASRIPIALLADQELPGDDAVSPLRTHWFAEPMALQPGDIIAVGERIASPSVPSTEGDGDRIIICLSDRRDRDGTCIDVPDCIAIAFLTKEDNAPRELWERAMAS